MFLLSSHILSLKESSFCKALEKIFYNSLLLLYVPVEYSYFKYSIVQYQDGVQKWTISYQIYIITLTEISKILIQITIYLHVIIIIYLAKVKSMNLTFETLVC